MRPCKCNSSNLTIDNNLGIFCVRCLDCGFKIASASNPEDAEHIWDLCLWIDRQEIKGSISRVSVDTMSILPMCTVHKKFWSNSL